MPTDDDILTQRMLGTGKNYEPVPELPTEDEEALEATTEIPKEAGVFKTTTKIPEEAGVFSKETGVFLGWPALELTKGLASGLERQLAEEVGPIADDIQERSLDIMVAMEDLESERVELHDMGMGPGERRQVEITNELKALQDRLDVETEAAVKRMRRPGIPSLTASPEGRGAMEAALANMEAPSPFQGVSQADFALADEVLRQSMGDDAYRAFKDVSRQTLELSMHKGLSSQKLAQELEDLANAMLESHEAEIRVQQLEGARFMPGDAAKQTIEALKAERIGIGYRSVGNLAQSFRQQVFDTWPGGRDLMSEELVKRIEQEVDEIQKRVDWAVEKSYTNDPAAKKAISEAIERFGGLQTHVARQHATAAGDAAVAKAGMRLDDPEIARRPAAPPGGGRPGLVQMAQEAMEAGTLRDAGGATAIEIMDAWERAQDLPAAGIADIPPQQISRANLHGAVVDDLLQGQRNADFEAFLNTQGKEGSLPPGVTMEKIKGSIRKILNDPPTWLETLTIEGEDAHHWNGSEWVVDRHGVNYSGTGDEMASKVLGEGRAAGLGSYYDEFGTKGRPPGGAKPLWEMTLEEFKDAAKRGKIHKATGSFTAAERRAQTALTMGEAAGYTPDDIAHFYAKRRGAFLEKSEGMPRPTREYFESQIKSGYDPFSTAHEELIREAIVEGKTVPSEVRSLYPDLAHYSRRRSLEELAAELERHHPHSTEALAIEHEMDMRQADFAVEQQRRRDFPPQEQPTAAPEAPRLPAPEAPPPIAPAERNLVQMTLNELDEATRRMIFDDANTVWGEHGLLDREQMIKKIQEGAKRAGVPEERIAQVIDGVIDSYKPAVERVRLGRPKHVIPRLPPPIAPKTSLTKPVLRSVASAFPTAVKWTPLDLLVETTGFKLPTGMTPPLMRTAGEPYDVYQERTIEREAGAKARFAEEEYWRTHTVDLNQMSPAERIRYDAWQKREAETEELLQQYLFNPELGPGSPRPSYLPYLDED